jgi:hypothetical protein
MEETMWKEIYFDSAYAVKNIINNLPLDVSLRGTIYHSLP